MLLSFGYAAFFKCLYFYVWFNYTCLNDEQDIRKMGNLFHFYQLLYLYDYRYLALTGFPFLLDIL